MFQELTYSYELTSDGNKTFRKNLKEACGPYMIALSSKVLFLTPAECNIKLILTTQFIY